MKLFDNIRGGLMYTNYDFKISSECKDKIPFSKTLDTRISFTSKDDNGSQPVITITGTLDQIESAVDFINDYTIPDDDNKLHIKTFNDFNNMIKDLPFIVDVPESYSKISLMLAINKSHYISLDTDILHNAVVSANNEPVKHIYICSQHDNTINSEYIIFQWLERMLSGNRYIVSYTEHDNGGFALLSTLCTITDTVSYIEEHRGCKVLNDFNFMIVFVTDDNVYKFIIHKDMIDEDLSKG